MPYSGDPGESKTDAVRFIVGDTIVAKPKYSDEEIEWLLKEADDDVYRAALMAALQLQQKYATMAKKSVGDLSISYSEAASGMSELIKALRERLEGTAGDDEFAAVPWMHGADSGLLRVPAFRIGMHDDLPYQAPLDPDRRRDGSPY